MLNIYHIETANHVNGNGCRYVLWLQGCDLGCVGCWNQQTWSFEDKTLLTVEEVFAQISSLEHKLDGVTFSGGEPFLQSLELSQLAKRIKDNTTLDLQVFTGFDKDELTETAQSDLLRYTDILVAGRYDHNKENNNQTVYVLNDKVDVWQFNNSDVEIEIDDDLNMKITGYPTNELIKEIEGVSNARV